MKTLKKINFNESQKNTVKKKSFKTFISVIRAVFLIGICFVILYPFVTKICFSFMSVKDVFNPNITFLPRNFTLKNYDAAIELLGYGKTFLNTALLSFSTSLVQLISALMVGYGFARFNFRGRNFLFATVVMVMVIPPDLLLLSRFFQFRFFDPFGLISLITGEVVSVLDTYIPFLLIGITATGLKNGLYIFMMRQFFWGFPKVIEEAAYVDGAGPIQTFIRIMLPSSMTMSVTIFLFSFVWQWNDDIFVPVFLTNMDVFSTKISSLASNEAAVMLGTNSISIASSLVTNAGIVLVFFPVIILYAFGQRFFVQSIENSGIVG